MAEIHDRMPVMLPPSAWAEWLDPENDDLETLGKLLVPGAGVAHHDASREHRGEQRRSKGAELADPIDAERPKASDRKH